MALNELARDGVKAKTPEAEIPFVALRAFRTETRFDWGSLVHFVYGLLSGWLGPWQPAVAAAVFLFKQAVDVRSGERSEEASGDVAEFAQPGSSPAGS